jgi:hypothetical protein
MAFVDKENVLGTKSKGDLAKRAGKASDGAAAGPLKGGIGGGRVPLKANVPGNVPVNSESLDRTNSRLMSIDQRVST